MLPVAIMPEVSAIFGTVSALRCSQQLTLQAAENPCTIFMPTPESALRMDVGNLFVHTRTPGLSRGD